VGSVNVAIGEKIAEGAESIVLRGSIMGVDVVVKIRVSRSYRHPEYDRVFRSYRTRMEVRVMADLLAKGLRVPTPILVDMENYVIVMTLIRGRKLSHVINDAGEETLKEIYQDIGHQVGVMHASGIYHGDLTVSNIMITDRKEAYLIDFGLSGYSRDVEEYAIDLHLFDRSTRNLTPARADELFEAFLKGYQASFPGYLEVVERMKDIRRRGRYIEERLRRKLRREAYTS